MIPNAKYVHVNLIAKDWEKLADFYEKVFGCVRLKPERDLTGKWLDELTEIPKAHIRGAHLALPGYEGNYPTLEIFQYEPSEKENIRKINKPGFGHIAFLVDDVSSALQEVISNGGSRIGNIVQTNVPGAGLLTVIYATDPEGNFIELQNWKK